MLKLKEFFSEFNLTLWPGKTGLKVFCAVFLVIVSLSYCFRENVLQKVEVYNAEVTAVEPYYIGISSVLPADGTADVSLNYHIDVVFNDNIDMLTVNDTTTFIVDDGTGPVSGSFLYDTALKNIIFTPVGGFAAATTYTVTLTTGIKNMVGESMAADYSWSFATVAAAQPEIYVFSPLAEIFTGDAYDFGSLTTPVNFTIGNSGNAGLNISSIALTSGTDFNIAVTPAAPKIIAAGTSEANSFTITFNPSSAGIKNDILTITSNDADESSFSINLTAESLAAPAPEIQVTNGGIILVTGVTTVDFGTVSAGSTGSITLVMYNIGSDDLLVTGIIEGGNNPEFFATDFAPVPSTITAGSTKIFNITFSPAGNGNKKADIIFQNTDLDEASFTIKVKGRGV
ncbi:MAG TPA: choice-of-anchor D domain-containing protein [Spirochaetota bacterium]|nr:choice-of-anchor D domain-containing protein [Spirochaetota bacterium]